MALWRLLSLTKALQGSAVGMSAPGACLSPIRPSVLSVPRPLSSVPPSHVQPFRPERGRVRFQWWESGSIPSGNSQRYYLICPLLSDAEIELQELDMTSGAGTHLTWMECSLKGLTRLGCLTLQQLIRGHQRASPQPPRRGWSVHLSKGYKDIIACIFRELGAKLKSHSSFIIVL